MTRPTRASSLLLVCLWLPAAVLAVSNAGTIEEIYQTALQRAPSAVELETASVALARGTTGRDLLEYLQNSAEFYARTEVRARTTEDGVRVRLEPGNQAMRLATLAKGAEVRLLSRLGEWYGIETAEGQKGFVRGAYLSLGNRPSLRIAEDDPEAAAQRAAERFAERVQALREAREALLPTLAEIRKIPDFSFRPESAVAGEKALSRYNKELERFLRDVPKRTGRAEFVSDAAIRGIARYAPLATFDDLAARGVGYAVIPILSAGSSRVPGTGYADRPGAPPFDWLKFLKTEAARRDIRLVALADLLDFGAAEPTAGPSSRRPENGFGKCPAPEEGGTRHPADPALRGTRERALAAIRRVSDLGVFAGIALANFREPRAPGARRDLRELYAFHPASMSAFKTASGLDAPTLPPEKVGILKSFRAGLLRDLAGEIRTLLKTKGLTFWLLAEDPAKTLDGVHDTPEIRTKLYRLFDRVAVETGVAASLPEEADVRRVPWIRSGTGETAPPDAVVGNVP